MPANAKLALERCQLNKSFKLNISHNFWSRRHSNYVMGTCEVFMGHIPKRSYIYQKAKQIKRDKSISLTQAKNLAVRDFDFVNYQHYLNVLAEKKAQIISNKKTLLDKINLVKDIEKKAKLLNQCLANYSLTFEEFFLSAIQLSASEHFNSICKRFISKGDIQAFLLKKEQKPPGYLDYRMDFEYYNLKDLIIDDLEYEMDENTPSINVEGCLKVTLEFEHEVPEEIKDYPHFRDIFMTGDFGISVCKDKKMKIEHVSGGYDI